MENESSPLQNGRQLRPFMIVIQPGIAEFIGTTLFVFVGCMSVDTNNILGIALAHGFMIFLLVSGLGPISGGHFNPVVTLGVVLSGKLRPLVGLVYFISQILGGMVGAALVKGVMPTDAFDAIKGGAHELGPSVTPIQGILCELVLTTVLVLSVLMTAVDTDTNNLAPVAIGFSVAADIIAGAKISGASMNPARSFGPAVVVSSFTTEIWTHHYVYWAGPILGSLVATVLYRLTLGNQEKRLIFK